MGKNLDPRTIYQYIVNDFEDAWNSLAWNPSARGRGNFMFARQAKILLEFAARLFAPRTKQELLSMIYQQPYSELS